MRRTYFLRIIPEEILFLHDLQNDYALVQRQSRTEWGWVPKAALKPVLSYSFRVELILSQRTGLICEEIDGHGLMVVKVKEGSVLDQWNRERRKIQPRQQVVPGDLIVELNGQDASDMVGMKEIFRKPRHQLTMTICRGSLHRHPLEQ